MQVQTLPELKPGFLVTYACATENLTGETAASRARAKKMKKAYAKTC